MLSAASGDWFLLQNLNITERLMNCDVPVGHMLSPVMMNFLLEIPVIYNQKQRVCGNVVKNCLLITALITLTCTGTEIPLAPLRIQCKIL